MDASRGNSGWKPRGRRVCGVRGAAPQRTGLARLGHWPARGPDPRQSSAGQRPLTCRLAGHQDPTPRLGRPREGRLATLYRSWASLFQAWGLTAGRCGVRPIRSHSGLSRGCGAQALEGPQPRLSRPPGLGPPGRADLGPPAQMPRPAGSNLPCLSPHLRSASWPWRPSPCLASARQTQGKRVPWCL